MAGKITNMNDYSRGYRAGKLTKDEELMLRTTALVLEHCNGWSIGGKQIKNSDGYVKLARIFADRIIEYSK